MAMTETIDTDNYEVMAKAMGITADAGNKGQQSSLARLRISHSPIMGEAEVKGKKVNMEVVAGGYYKLDVPDSSDSIPSGIYYAPAIKIRTFLQRFMYKRFIKGSGSVANRFAKTVMGESLKVDLKDNDGGFNCGKPTGWIKDFKALPQSQQTLIKEIKRTRVVFGLANMEGVVNDKGEDIDKKLVESFTSVPFIWEIDNRSAFKLLGDTYNGFTKRKLLPISHDISLGTDEQTLPNGSSFYLPTVEADFQNTIAISQDDHTTFKNFMDWVDNYNEYIVGQWSKKTESLSVSDEKVLDQFHEVDEEVPF